MRKLIVPLIAVFAFALSLSDVSVAQQNPCQKKETVKQNPCNPCAKKETQSAKKESAEVTVTGEVIDTKCYLTGMMGGRGEEHEDCAIACIKGGLPPGIVEDKTGTVYILTPEKGTKGGNEALVQYAAKTITVKGKVVEKGGSKLLLYSSIVAK